MCLRNEDLHMVYCPSKKKYIGIGYKSMYTWREGTRCRVYGGVTLKTGVWYDALKVQNEGQWENRSQLELIRSYGGSNTQYAAGFHIFLNPKHAAKYGSKHDVFKVEYYDIIGFGRNQTKGTNSGPCVIAHKMRILGKINPELI